MTAADEYVLLFSRYILPYRQTTAAEALPLCLVAAADAHGSVVMLAEDLLKRLRSVDLSDTKIVLQLFTLYLVRDISYLCPSVSSFPFSVASLFLCSFLPSSTFLFLLFITTRKKGTLSTDKSTQEDDRRCGPPNAIKIKVLEKLCRSVKAANCLALTVQV